MRAPCTMLRPTPPHPNTATSSPFHLRRGWSAAPYTGNHGAAEQGRAVERHTILVDPDDGVVGQYHLLGEAAHAEERSHGFAVGGHAIHRTRRRIVGEVAKMATSTLAEAGIARTKVVPGRDHVVTETARPVTAEPHGLDHPGRLMAEDHRRRAREELVERGEVAMAHAAGLHAKKHFVGSVIDRSTTSSTFIG